MVFGKFAQKDWSRKLLRIHQKMKYISHPAIHKQSGILLTESCEGTPIIWQNRLLFVNFQREGAGGMAVKVVDYFTGEVLKTASWIYGLGCALVEHNQIHVFGTSNWDHRNAVFKAVLDEQFQPTETVKIWEASENQVIFNTSVCPGKDGFVMAYEVREPNVKNFSIRFLTSADLMQWRPVGILYRPDIYAACPTIRYCEGYYYIIYLQEDTAYVECISRTQDFLTFEEYKGTEKLGSDVRVLSPKGHLAECTNNSDIDLVEFNNMVYMVYTDGDQRHWSNVRRAVYCGTMKQFFGEFWD